jgi:hypothetical protein
MNKFQSIYKPLTWLMAFLLCAFMVGCGGGSGSGGSTISGMASKGPLNGSTVCAYAIAASGVQGAQLGNCSSNIVAGNYSINLENHTGPVLLTATSGVYTDEVSGATVNLSTPLHSMLLNATGSNSVAVTPLTELAYRKASALVGGLSNANIQSSINTIQINFGVADIVSTMPVDARNTSAVSGATVAQQNYTLALATISQYMATTGQSLTVALGNLQSTSTQGGVSTLLSQAMTTFKAANSAFSSTTLSSLAVSSITVSPASAVVPSGGTQQFVATGIYSDASSAVITTSSSWASDNTGYATVAASGVSAGLATGVAAGSANITATIGTKHGSAVLTVPVVTLLSIAITPANAVIAVGGAQQFVATGTYSDASSAVVTTSATWASASSVVATVAALGVSAGLATGVTASASSVAITATIGAVSGVGVLTVNAPVANPTAPTFGEAGRFVLMANQAITTTLGSAIINGDIGITPAARSFITGFTTFGSAGNYVELTGTTAANGISVASTSYAPDDANPAPFPYPLHYSTPVVGAAWATTAAMLTQANTDLGIAETFLAAGTNPSSPVTTLAGTELGGLTLTRGVYSSASDLSVSTPLTLDAGGDPTAVFIITTGGKITTAANIVLAHGALARNVYWRSAGITTIAAGTSFYGNVVAHTTVVVNAGANITGSLYGVIGQVTLVSDTVTKAP